MGPAALAVIPEDGVDDVPGMTDRVSYDRGSWETPIGTVRRSLAEHRTHPARRRHRLDRLLVHGCGSPARLPSLKRVRESRRVRQMSSHRTVGGLPALLQPARTRNDTTRTHDQA